VDALVDINALAPGSGITGRPMPLLPLRKLNDLIDSLSTDKDFVYTTVENIFAWTAGPVQIHGGQSGRWNLQRHHHYQHADDF